MEENKVIILYGIKFIFYGYEAGYVCCSYGRRPLKMRIPIHYTRKGDVPRIGLNMFKKLLATPAVFGITK